MSDVPFQLPTLESAESIPAVLAAPRKRKARAVEALPAPVADEHLAAPTAAAPATSTQEDTTMATTVENMTETATAKTQAMFGDMKDRAEGAMAKGQAMFADMGEFNRGNVEALVESGKIAVAGMQTLAQGQAAWIRKQFEEATAAARTLATVKSPTEMLKLQGDYVRQQFDAMVAETSRSTEAALKLAGEVAQPISNRFALAAEKVRQAA